MSPLRSGAWALLVLLLSGCAGQVVREPVPAVAIEQALAGQAERASVLAGLPQWRLTGRAAISQGDKGGSGRMEWVQDGEAFRVSLAAPVTRQSWTLEVQPGRLARLEGLEGGVREGADPALLLREATGWDIPVQDLAWWIRGLAAPGRAQPRFGADGLPASLADAGWQIDYQEWRAAEGAFPAMPRRLQASRGAARVRLVLDAWEASTP